MSAPPPRPTAPPPHSPTCHPALAAHLGELSPGPWSQLLRRAVSLIFKTKPGTFPLPSNPYHVVSKGARFRASRQPLVRASRMKSTVHGDAAPAPERTAAADGTETGWARA